MLLAMKPAISPNDPTDNAHAQAVQSEVLWGDAGGLNAGDRRSASRPAMPRYGRTVRQGKPGNRTYGLSRESAVQTIGAREDRERITRIRNRRCYGRADRRHLGHAGARRRRRQAGQGKKRKRRPDARHNGGSHWENRVKGQHGFDPQNFNHTKRYAPARIAAVTARTARAQSNFPNSFWYLTPQSFALLSSNYSGLARPHEPSSPKRGRLRDELVRARAP
jgi:hypothetical protein